MSAYIHFYVKSKNDNFCPIAIFCRSSYMYQTFTKCADIPWEGITPINHAIIQRAYDIANNAQEVCEENLKEFDTEKELICHMVNASIDERLEKIYSLNEYVEEVKDAIEEINRFKTFLDGLMIILDSIDWDSDYDVNNYIYAGLEISDPTIEDIK